MLVLTRKIDESLRIGDDIKITVLRVKGNTVRIGIEAPRDVRVVRHELKSLDVAGDEQASAETSPTVVAIVDSPTVASPRLFEARITAEISGGFEAEGDSDQGVHLEEVALNPDAHAPVAPLRDFFRSHRGLTAVS